MWKNGQYGLVDFSILAIAMASLLACQEQASPLDPTESGLSASAAQTDRVTVRESFDFTQDNVCLGEEVHWTGEIVVNNSFVNTRGCCDPGLFMHLHQYSRLTLDGEGLETGSVYSLTGHGVPRDDFFCPAFGLPTPCVLDFGFESPSPVNFYPQAGRPSGAGQTISSTGTGVLADPLYRSIVVINGAGELVIFDETRRNTECFVVPPAVDLPFNF